MLSPEYLAYCASHGMLPEVMASVDDEYYPGGRMAGFLIWSQGINTEWRKIHKLGRDDYISPAQIHDLQEFKASRPGSCTLGRCPCHVRKEG